MEQQPSELKAALLKQAKEFGFAEMKICKPDSVPELPQRLKAFVDDGRHGQMKWMEERMNWRASPSTLWPDAKSVIMLAEPYTPETDPLENLEYSDRATISVYAQNRDYHDLVKKRLKRLGRWLIEQDSETEIKVFVDTAPVMEKPLGEASGLGWQGKHTNLVSRELGNWFFLGAIFTTAELPVDAPEEDHCGSCRACLDICPTDAFPAPYQLDARRCISYLTIEHDGPVDLELRAKMGNRIYGCDDCLAVCPWNKFAQSARDLGYTPREELTSPKLAELAMLDDASFRTLFSKSPIKRIGRNRFVRNVSYAIGNSGDPKLLDIAKYLCNDEDRSVADGGLWATERLSGAINGTGTS